MCAESIVDFLWLLLFMTEIFDDESLLEVRHVTLFGSMEGKMPVTNIFMCDEFSIG
jgi:hypothetical protein